MKFFIFQNNKSQAAMEFLMAYGWAILVVLVAIGALAYFGVLSPQKFLPERCILESGFSCVSHKVEPSRITLIISNAKGRDITITNIKVADCESGLSQDLANGAQSSFTVGGSCSNGIQKERFDGEISISYTEKDTGLTKTAFGNLNTKI